MADAFKNLISDDETKSLAHRSLEAVRLHLDMDVAYISRIEGDESVFQTVDAPGLEHLVAPGDRRSLDDVYCRHILEGRLPELIPDTAMLPLAVAMPITRLAPIGAHVSVPIRRSNGSVYGMFCCLRSEPSPTLNERDLHIFRAYAELVGREIDRDLEDGEALDVMRTRIRDVLDAALPAIALQPIVHLSDGAIIGFEALARFAQEPQRSPDQWFAEAERVGLGVELEVAAIIQASALLSQIPAPLTLSMNVSPATMVSDQLAVALRSVALDRVILEITEHATVSDYPILIDAIATYRRRGAKVVIDDAGAGISGLQHIIKLAPDIIKLDMSLTRRVDCDPAREALAMAMVLFARRTGIILVAEGVEKPAERDVLRILGVSRAQGYLFGRPSLAARLQSKIAA